VLPVRVSPERLVYQDLQDLLEVLGRQDQLALPVPKAQQEQQAMRDNPVMLELLDGQEPTGHPDKLELRDLKVSLDHRDKMAHLALLVILERLDLLDQEELLES
jgi:hypothetical protein